MPFPPKVPHIVGDESDEAEQGSSEVLPIQADRNNAANSIANRRSADESETSESTGEDETDDEVEESLSSSNDGADWSMDVTHIARTPERHRLIESEVDEANENDTNMEFEEPMNNPDTPAVSDVGEVAATSSISSCESQSDTDTRKFDKLKKGTTLIDDSLQNSCTKAQQDSSMDPSPCALDLSIDDAPFGREQQYQKGTLAADLQVSSSNSESEITIGEKNEAENNNNKTPSSPLYSPLLIGNPSRHKLVLPRIRVHTAADYSTPPTIGGRVAKRARRGTILNQGQKSELEDLLAKPLDVTMYFQELSAKLVKSRVKLMAFLSLRNHIDNFVDQTMTNN